VLRAAASLVMGVAVCAMHYTGMRAAEFICTVEDSSIAPRGAGYFSPAELPTLIAFIAMTLAALIVVYHLYQESSEHLDDLEPAGTGFG
jgi:NO-binding membrane sensor protein with MHYT domain